MPQHSPKLLVKMGVLVAVHRIKTLRLQVAEVQQPDRAIRVETILVVAQRAGELAGEAAVLGLQQLMETEPLWGQVEMVFQAQ